MKKALFKVTFFLLAALLFNSCQPKYKFTNIEPEIKTFGFDFRKYVNEGFLFLPNDYKGKYEVMGTLRVEMHPKVTYPGSNEPRENPRDIDDVYSTPKPVQDKPITGHIQTRFVIGNRQYIQRIKVDDPNELIEYVYNTSIEMGGDAFINFKYSIEFEKTDDNENTSYPVNVISGMIIKRIS